MNNQETVVNKVETNFPQFDRLFKQVHGIYMPNIPVRRITSLEKEPIRDDWNVRITRFFLGNGRTTVLIFLIFLLIGMISFTSLKTTGFPSPEIKIALLRTIYPQANAQTVADQVTSPLEIAIKNITGVESFSSTSSDNFSLITVQIAANATKDTVVNKIATEIAGVKLPDGAQKPVFNSIDIGGPDFIFSLYADNSENAYNVQQNFLQVTKALDNTAEVTIANPIKKVIEVSYEPLILQQKGLSDTDITNVLTGANQVFPVSLNQTLDGRKVNILTAIQATSLEDIQNLTITKQLPGASNLITFKLGEVTNVDLTYRQDIQILNGVKTSEADIVANALSIGVKAKKDTDLSGYSKSLQEVLKKLPNVQFSSENSTIQKNQSVLLVENYSINTSNQKQVGEIIHGLIGGALKTPYGVLNLIGWLFGALQLVFLVMLVFVSWRAALIASLSIPLSILSSMIYLYFSGNSLNTLVLFSLVLVIGLVVDPALVILEGLQRKIDAGMQGKDAAIAAVRDIGPGLFIATLANIIVFVPLAIISGTLGQIFAFIPATVIPALIGAYFIPLIFLTFLGSFFLKRGKNKTDVETENLWPFAKWLIKFNLRILYSSAWLRLIIIIGILGLSLGVVGTLFANGKITFAQFSDASDSENLILTTEYKNNLTSEEKTQSLKSVLSLLLTNPDINNAYPVQTSYFVNLRSKENGRTTKARLIADQINPSLQFAMPNLNAKLSVAQNGPPSSDYQVQLAINSSDLKISEQASLALNGIVKKACNIDKKFEFENCENQKAVVEKIKDSFSDTKQTNIRIVIDALKLQQNKLILASIPASLLVNAQVKNSLLIQKTDPVTSITTPTENLDIYITKTGTAVNNLEMLKNYQLTNLSGQKVALSEIATFQQNDEITTITKLNGTALTRYQIALTKEFSDPGSSATFVNSLLKYINTDNGKAIIEKSGINADQIKIYSVGGTAGFTKSFGELVTALGLAIVIVYALLALFLRSFSQPIVVLFTIPLTFIGIFPALATFSGGQFGFLEIIGLIILTGLVINAAIFLIDAARQQEKQGLDDKNAIAIASGIRLRPVLLTKFTAVASLSPLVFTSEFYKNLALVIIFGIITSGFLSLITTPILYIAFRRASTGLTKLFIRTKKPRVTSKGR